jgi:hypothetical protein
MCFLDYVRNTFFFLTKNLSISLIKDYEHKTFTSYLQNHSHML